MVCLDIIKQQDVLFCICVVPHSFGNNLHHCGDPKAHAGKILTGVEAKDLLSRKCRCHFVEHCRLTCVMCNT